MATPETFMPRVVAHLSQLPDDEIAKDAIRDAVRELCMVAPIFRRVKEFSPAREMMNLIDDGEDPHDDRRNDFKLAGVAEVLLGEYPIERRTARDTRYFGSSRIWWDVDGECVVLQNLRPSSGDDYVFAQPVGGVGSHDIFSPVVPVWIEGGVYEAGDAVIYNRNWFTARRAIGAAGAVNTLPDLAGNDNWSPGATAAARGWQRMRRGDVPDGWEILENLGQNRRATIHYSVHPSRRWNDIDDVVFERYAGAVAAGALTRISMQYHHGRTPPEKWMVMWRQEKSAAAIREVGIGRRQTSPMTGIRRVFNRSGYF